MDLHRHPGLVDRLAGEYALGVLRGAARRRFEHIARSDAAVRVAVEEWQARVRAMVELGPCVAPPLSVWEGIARRLELSAARSAALAGGETPAPGAASARAAAPPRQPASRQASGSRWFESLSFWRGWSVAATAAAVLALAVALRPLVPQTQTQAPAAQVAEQPDGPGIERVAYMAALNDVQTNKTMMVVMWDQKSAMMTVHRMGGDTGPSGHSEQLWGMPQNGHPVSLGVIPPGGTIRMKVHGMDAYLKLAVSKEPQGGSPDPNGPTGPVMCVGKLMATA
ncbi:anti-sigma factor [Trinickia mobilis]|uniref:anti-sigma factor n=1 Tax=Trinickia mobilis TaxID=2816356 RepID=UPI001A8C3E29|nr:anti-sigma factor [Trinickia mobilis]